MHKVAQKEHDILTNNGFELIPSRAKNEYRRIFRNGDFETIIKEAQDEFTYYYDVNVNADDIDRANGNITEDGLCWEEIKSLIRM